MEIYINLFTILTCSITLTLKVIWEAIKKRFNSWMVLQWSSTPTLIAEHFVLLIFHVLLILKILPHYLNLVNNSDPSIPDLISEIELTLICLKCGFKSLMILLKLSFILIFKKQAKLHRIGIILLMNLSSNKLPSVVIDLLILYSIFLHPTLLPPLPWMPQISLFIILLLSHKK